MQRNSRDKLIRQVDFIFYHEKELRKLVISEREDIQSRKKEDGVPGNSFISDPTATEAMRNATELKAVTLECGYTVHQPERWLKVIDSVYNWCDEIPKKVATQRYSGKDYRRTCAELCISTSSYGAIMTEIRYKAIMCACQLGLMTVC